MATLVNSVVRQKNSAELTPWITLERDEEGPRTEGSMSTWELGEQGLLFPLSPSATLSPIGMVGAIRELLLSSRNGRHGRGQSGSLHQLMVR